MKYCLFFALLMASASVFAQQTDEQRREAASKPQTPADKKLRESNLYAHHLSALRTVFAEKKAPETRRVQSELLTLMRTALAHAEAEKRTAKSGDTVANNAERKARIIAAFDGYEFDPGQPAAAEPKFVLLDEFQQLLLNEYEALRKTAPAEKR
jgi:hypothetical protein